MAFQQTLSSHSVFFIPWDTPANNSSRAQVFHIIRVRARVSHIMLSPCPFSSQLLLSSTHHLMLSLCLSLIREVKMIPRSMWRQCADSSSTKDKEKESKRWALGKIEERNRPTPLPRACPPCRRNKQRRMQTAL
ncbi:hypothetical protein EV2_019269 [Malus domestica]